MKRRKDNNMFYSDLHEGDYFSVKNVTNKTYIKTVEGALVMAKFTFTSPKKIVMPKWYHVEDEDFGEVVKEGNDESH